MPPDLNWDILFEILSAISDEIICLEENSKPARRLLSLMGTCRTLYKVGMPKLRKSDICIGSATLPRAVKFTDFILRDTSWPPCLKSLTVMTMMYSTWSRRNHSASRTNLALNMERILRQAPNLSSLEMDDAESLFSLTSRLGRAVSSLTKLNSIALHCVGDKTIAGLQKLRSPLTSVNLDFETYDSDLKDLDFLTYRKVHLTSLELSRTDDMAFCRTRYQNVHTLNIHSREPIHVRSVMTCFPNVKNFKWDPELDVKFDEDFAEERHASRDRDDNDDVDYSWKALGTLSADVFPCHALRLRGCHVRLWQGINLRPAELRLFGEALNEIRPTSLRMMLRLENWKTDMARLGDMYPLLVDITHLHITLDFTRCQLDLSTFMEELVRFLQGTPLVYLYLKFDYRLDTGRTAQADPMSELMLDYLQAFDTRDYAFRLALNHQDLEHVAIDGEHLDISFWRVVRGDSSEPTLLKLSKSGFWDIRRSTVTLTETSS